MTQDASHEMLVLWLTLQRATKRAAVAANIGYLEMDPASSNDSEVATAWDALTSPQNLDALVNWREAAIANQYSPALVDKAIEHCRARGHSQ